MDKAVKIDLTSDIAGKRRRSGEIDGRDWMSPGFPVDEQLLPVALKTPRNV